MNTHSHLVDGKYGVQDLIDLAELRQIFERFTSATGFTIGFLDHPGLNILIATGWQDVCTRFHRVSPLSAAHCAQSNKHLLESLDEPGKLVISECENGLVDCAFPIIVKGIHIASLATGQLFLKKPDLDRFRRQAKTFGFDEQEYLKAVEIIPVISEEKLKSMTLFLGELASVLSQLGYSQLIIKEDAERLQAEAVARNHVEEQLLSQTTHIRHLNDVLHSIRNVDQLILRERDPDKLLQEACQILVQTRGYLMVWVGQPETGSKHVKMIACAGVGSNPTENTPVTWDDSPTGRGPSGTAIRERRTVVLNDIRTDPNFAPWRQAVASYGAFAIASAPLLAGQNLFGAITVKADQVNAFDAEEVELLGTMAGNLAQALQAIKDEAALRESEERFRSLYTSMSEGMAFHQMLYDPAGAAVDYVITAVNPAFEAILGLSSAMTAGRKASELYGTGSAPYLDVYAKVLATGQPVHFETTFTPMQKCFRISASALNKDQFVTVFEDITQQKQAEKLREKMEIQLRQAQKMESVGRLAGGVAHDFNNMLGVILGHTELASEQLDPSVPIYDSLVEIRKAARRSADLTQQLLAFSRKQVIVPKVLDLNEAVVDLLKMLQRLIGENIILDWKPKAMPCLVKVDPSQLDQVLTNLCVNARDAIAKSGKISIETGNSTFDETYCSLHPDAAPGEYVSLTVSDTGGGMEPQTLSHIFEPFFTTKEVGKGTGLGLATVYGIIQQSQGFIDVTSTPGQGTTFRIHLPLQKGQPGQDQRERTEIPDMQKQQTILLVEDEPNLLNVTKTMLEKQGHIVLTANLPSEAVRLVKIHGTQIDMVITDIVMPEINGRDLISKLLAMNPNLKYLFVSGYSSNFITDDGIMDEGVHFIQKPFSVKSLSSKVAEILNQV